MRYSYGNGAGHNRAGMNDPAGSVKPPPSLSVAPPPRTNTYCFSATPLPLSRRPGRLFRGIALAALLPLLFFAACADPNNGPSDPTVTGVSVNPSTESVAKGGSKTFTATVTGENSPPQTVTWSIVESGTAFGTAISSGGVLTVASGETLAALTVRATSTFDSTKSGTATVTVTGGPPTVTGVSVIPSTASVAKGGNRTFTAEVTGTNNPDQTVAWTVEGGVGGTNISDAGLLSVAANETAGTLTVRATSTFDTTKSGTAEVTVTEVISVDDSTAITDYLNNASGGTAASDPVFLAITGTLSGENWTALLSAIQTEDKYVALDLSAASMSGAEFDPGTANTGESKIVSLALPNAATSIKAGDNDNPTFKNFTALTGVSGSAVETVGDHAFDGCTSLAELSLPKATDIGNSAFSGCTSLTELNLPAATSIGSVAFFACTSLAELSLPKATSIGGSAFQECMSLAELSLPKATSIGASAFSVCTSLAELSLPAAISIGERAFSGTSLAELSLPAATDIGSYAFADCTSLTTVSLPAATDIGEGAFGYTGGTALTVTLGSTVPTLGETMFDSVNTAKTVTVKVPSGADAWTGKTGTFSGNDAAANWGNGFRGGGWDGSTFQLDGVINSNITLTVTGGTPTVTGVSVIPSTESVAKGESKTFTATVTGTNNPDKTVTWTVEGGVGGTNISDAGLLSVAANETAGTLTVRATSTVDTTKSGTANVTVTGGGTPDGAIAVDDITAITNHLNNASGGADASDPVSLAVTGSLSSANWAALLSAIKNVDKYVALDLSAASMTDAKFDPGTANTGESKIVSLTLPNAATSIKEGDYDSTFKNFTALTGVSGSAVETVCDYAFFRCTSLTTVSLPKATDIGYYAFYQCTSLTTVSLPKATDIDRYAFYQTSLTTVSLPAATEIDENAFAWCESLAELSLPAATDINRSAFAHCTSLAKVSLPAATDIGRTAFANCTSLTTVSLPKATEIGGEAFAYCTALTTVSLPAVTHISGYAFNDTGGTALTVTLGRAVPTLGNSLFGYGDTAKTVTVKVPSGATAWSGQIGTFSGDDTTVKWGNGFRGKGWDGSAFSSNDNINSNITVIVKYE